MAKKRAATRGSAQREQGYESEAGHTFIDPAWGNAAMIAAMEAEGAGPASPELMVALEACFGPGVGSLDLEQGSARDASQVGAEAFCEGHQVNLGGMQPSMDDPHAVEILGHEVAHALAGGGDGQELLSQHEDLGERRADAAGQAFRGWVDGGLQGPPPQLRPAHGGHAAIHRYESSEHMDAVDGALTRALNSDDPKVKEKAQKSSQLLDGDQKIVLGNGVEVTPGQITALMGDFYGVFDENGAFDAAASFHQLYNGDAGDMQRLLTLMDKEKSGKEILPDEWEKAIQNRDQPLEYDGKTFQQYGYLDLAKRNQNHFSGPNSQGTDNNMGTYVAFHEMALNEAQSQASKGKSDQDLNMMLAMESCGMHYLTDRHAGGHSFEKSGVMEASGYMGQGLSKLAWPGAALAFDAVQGHGATANLFVKAVHDDWNEEGVQVSNKDGDTPWLAKGDGHWADADNAQNQAQTAKSVVTSFAELQSVLDGDTTSEALKQQGYGAHDTVPAWDPERQLQAEQEAKSKTFAGVAGSMGLGYGYKYGSKAVEENITEPVSNGYHDFIYEWSRWEDWMKQGNLPRF
ncbi:MAG: DUF4157 domain-containing protein [Alphaproteobacteria bacterium]|nr:DUF4157 domain-containing protein [Alphaproteobacteria bacterium]